MNNIILANEEISRFSRWLYQQRESETLLVKQMVEMGGAIGITEMYKEQIAAYDHILNMLQKYSK